MTRGTSGQLPERDPFDDRLERQLVTAAEQLERRRSARRRDGARARIAVGAATAVAALGSLVLAIALVDGDADPPRAGARWVVPRSCAAFARAGRLTVEPMEPPPVVAKAAPSLSPEALATGSYGGGIRIDRPEPWRRQLCPAPLGVGAIYDPHVVAFYGGARRAASALLSALRGPATSGIAPDRRIDRDDRGWKVCLSLHADDEPAPTAIACAAPQQVIERGLVALVRQPGGAPTVFAFYLATDARLLRITFADGRTDTTTLMRGFGSIERRRVGSDPARTPVAYRPIRGDGTPLAGGGPIDGLR